MNNVGMLLNRYRERHKLSLKALGASFSPSVTPQFLSRVEGGHSPLPTYHIETLVRVLGVPQGDLIEALTLDFETKLKEQLNVQSL